MNDKDLAVPMPRVYDLEAPLHLYFGAFFRKRDGAFDLFVVSRGEDAYHSHASYVVYRSNDPADARQACHELNSMIAAAGLLAYA